MGIIEFAKQSDTVLYHKSPIIKDIDRNDLLVLIPGNPGLINFYTCYLDLIQQEFPNFEILCISHAGCDPNSSSEFKFYGLIDQIQTKYEIIKEFINLANTNSPTKIKYNLHFLSHSVGCYINQRVVKLLVDDMTLTPHIDVKFIGLICPTIKDIAKSESGIRITKLFNYTPLVTVLPLLSTILNKLLPEKYLLYLIDYYKIIKKPILTDFVSKSNYDNSTMGAVNIVRNPNIIKQILLLAHEEMKFINDEKDVNDWFFLDHQTIGSNVKIWVFFADSDHWVNNETRDSLLKAYHDNYNKNIMFELGKLDDDITHSFCIDKSVEFSIITTNSIRQFNSK